MELPDFLLARIAEDEEAAEAAARHWHDDCLDAPVAQVELHAYRHDPARVRAECKAKRQIVEDLQDELANQHDPEPTTLQLAERTLLTLALPYADHPDYSEEWRP